MKTTALCAALLVLTGQSAAAYAQTAGTEPQPCELHVWAAAGLGATLQTAQDNFVSGLGENGGGLIGAALQSKFGGAPRKELEGDKRDVHTSDSAPAGPLDNAGQLAILQQLDLARMMGVGGHRAIFHAQSLNAAELKSPLPYAPNPASCYADLVISDVVYSREYANGQNLKSFVRFRDFGSGPAPVRKLSTWVQTKLAYAREGKKANVEGSDAELPQALAENLRKFAGFLGKAK